MTSPTAGTHPHPPPLLRAHAGRAGGRGRPSAPPLDLDQALAVLPPEVAARWRNVLEHDDVEQELLSMEPQPPFSDAYLAGAPGRRGGGAGGGLLARLLGEEEDEEEEGCEEGEEVGEQRAGGGSGGAGSRGGTAAERAPA